MTRPLAAAAAVLVASTRWISNRNLRLWALALVTAVAARRSRLSGRAG